MENDQHTPATHIPEGTMIIIPLRNRVLFPSMLMPLSINSRRRRIAVEEANRQQAQLGFVSVRDAAVESIKPADLYSVGAAAEIMRMFSLPDGQRQLLVQGRRRFKIEEFIATDPLLIARVTMIDETAPENKEFAARVLHLRQQAAKAFSLFAEPASELRAIVEKLENPLSVIDIVASTLDVSLEEKNALLGIFDPEARIRRVSELLAQRVELLELGQKISAETKGSLDKSQRQFYLREQLKAIQKELGEDDGKSSEIEELRQKILDAKMPAETEKEAMKELSRLERIPEMAAEYSMLRTYFDWLLELPWSVTTEDQIDLARARQILDADHHGLDKVKKRIIEFLAVRKLRPEGKSPILCLVGPPGVGKTSLGQSIAKAMNRKFVRQSLGGVHDEADIRGHRRTYIGALPGNILQSIRKAGSRNPVFLLDEIDKVSASYHGDPSAALLEVLDPAQNATFQDHYLGLPFDLSRVMFIATANILDTIPGPLRDRMEIVQLPGYTDEEKLAIAKEYLIPRQITENGLTENMIEIRDAAIKEIIRSYTREAGVRQLEREIGSVCRAIATRFAEGMTDRVEVGTDAIVNLLGPQKFVDEVALRTSVPGVATGLAWTQVGGDILFIEATKMPGDGKLILTGQLGDVMKESAQAALSLVKSRADTLGIAAEVFKGSDIHIHIPAGAIPKDGPSAGVTLFTALVSLLTERCINKHVAMTGEISLRGLVLPVGGIKEKVLAAKRAGIDHVLLPELNRKDIADIPAGVRDTMQFEFISNVDEALNAAVESCVVPVYPGRENLPLHSFN